jgi:ubiquinone/menaquinone biosynthesis C-methylase UbiE
MREETRFKAGPVTPCSESMSPYTDWKKHWDERSQQVTSDSAYNRDPQDDEIETLSEQELLSFIDPSIDDVVFDAGCGTGSNILLLHSKVKRIVGMDYSGGAVERCRRRIQSNNIENAEVREGSITEVPLPDSSVDKVLCMSVLQYVDDNEVTLAFNEFARILKDGGVLVLHVKNLSSPYHSTLLIGKRVKLLLGKQAKIGYYRSFRWYIKALRSFGFDILDFNSFSLFVLPGMPRELVLFLQKLELRNYSKPLFRTAFMRRHGSDLKIKAILKKNRTTGWQTTAASSSSTYFSRQ